MHYRSQISVFTLIVPVLALISASSSPFNRHNTQLDQQQRVLSPTVQCIGCTGLVGLFEQWQVYHSKSCTVGSMSEFCGMFPTIPFGLACRELVRIFGQNITNLITAGETVDVVCAAMTFCNVTKEAGTPQCHLFPLTETSVTLAPRLQLYRIAMLRYIDSLNFTSKRPQLDPSQANFDICTIPLISTVCHYLKNIFNHDSVFDIDQDRFSTMEALRGYAWRGRDCDDLLSEMRPGRQPLFHDFLTDSNCNGIRGTPFWPPGTSSYEQTFCANSSARGIAVLGDSASAHFHIPWQFLNATAVSSTMLENLTTIVENEGDFPHFSFVTGWQQEGQEGVVDGPVDSLYKRLRERNLCNHRDYQNIGVNGAESFSGVNFVNTLSRNTADKPLIVVYAYIGNDVCNHWFDTIDHDTHVLQFEQNLNATLLKLDQMLPMGSHVVVIDLVDARFLYDNMWNRTHPLGALRNDVKTKDFYDYLNCMDTSPCRGWLSSNGTLRNLTLQRVYELNRGIAETVLANQQAPGLHPNYKLHHVLDPIGDVFNTWIAEGGQLWQLIEPVDGFHPNQICSSIVAQVLWTRLMSMDEDIFGPINPYNQQIRNIFGDQGGQ